VVDLVRFVPQGWIGQYFNSSFPKLERGKQSPVGDLQSFNLRDVETQNKDELLRVVDFRFQKKLKVQPSLTTVFGDPDFLPFSFLTLGVCRGAAVCRLLENYEGSERINELTEIIRKSAEVRGSPYSINELCEMLAIKNPDDFFKDLDDNSASQALGDLEKIKQIMPISVGTGFLVGRNYLLTAQHVIKSRDSLKNFVAEFNYENNLDGSEAQVVRYELDPTFYASNENLDYALVRLKNTPLNADPCIGEAGDYFGWIPMTRDDNLIAPPLSLSQVEELKISPEQLNCYPDLQSRLQKQDITGNIPGLAGEPVSIIQHPKGRFKEIVLSNNRVQGISDNFLYYEADADYSSSGSPVFNAQWQLVALHHAYISERTSNRLNVLGYEGTRIFRIIGDLKAQANKSLEESFKKEVLYFIQKFVESDLDFVDQMSETIGKSCKI
jgi:V8-like Glu-specific endopeptidase